MVQAVGFLRFFRFAFQVDHPGDFHLHAVGEFVALHAGLEFIVLGVLGHVALVEEGELVEGLSLVFAGLVGRSAQVEDRGTGGRKRVPWYWPGRKPFDQLRDPPWGRASSVMTT